MRERRHGTSSCYSAGCKRPECRAARRKHDKMRELGRMRGTWRGKVVAVDERLTDHIRWLRDNHMTGADIGRQAGVDITVPEMIIRKAQDHVYPWVYDAIMGITNPQPSRVPVLGSSRRLQAVTYLGWSMRQFSGIVGIDYRSLNAIRCGRWRSVKVAYRDAIAAGYRIAVIQGPRTDVGAIKYVNVAARHGWHGPMAWDADIDDPNATPEVLDKRRRYALSDENYDDVMELIDRGYSRRQIAERFGVSRDSIESMIIRHRKRERENGNDE